MASAKSKNERIEAKKAPIYITIGPPCAGKTTFLQKLKNKHEAMKDIALDHELDVYVTVPTRLFLLQGNSTLSDEDQVVWNRRIQGKTVQQRIEDSSNAECRFILQRLAGQLSADEFQKQIQSLYDDHFRRQQERKGRTMIGFNIETNLTAEAPITKHQQEQQERNLQRQRDLKMIGDTIVKAVEEQVDLSKENDNFAVPETVELFVVESLFRPHPQTNQTGVEHAEAQFGRYATQNDTMAIAWGNTNTRPREYKTALQVAASCHRPVYFVVHSSTLLERRIKDGLLLPHQPLLSLITRNLQRMLRTGKFIPALSIFDSSSRIDNLLSNALNELERPYREAQKEEEPAATVSGQDDEKTSIVNGTSAMDEPLSFSSLQLNTVLCKMVHFQMNPDRTVSQLETSPTKRPFDSGNGSRSVRGRFGGSSNGPSHKQRGQHVPNDGWYQGNRDNRSFGVPRRGQYNPRFRGRRDQRQYQRSDYNAGRGHSVNNTRYRQDRSLHSQQQRPTQRDETRRSSTHARASDPPRDENSTRTRR